MNSKYKSNWRGQRNKTRVSHWFLCTKLNCISAVDLTAFQYEYCVLISVLFLECSKGQRSFSLFVYGIGACESLTLTDRDSYVQLKFIYTLVFHFLTCYWKRAWYWTWTDRNSQETYYGILYTVKLFSTSQSGGRVRLSLRQAGRPVPFTFGWRKHCSESSLYKMQLRQRWLLASRG